MLTHSLSIFSHYFGHGHVISLKPIPIKDRNFLQKLATRIVEVELGNLISWPGNFQNYLKLKEQVIEEETTRNALFDKRLVEEETWIRQGVKARRTRNEGGVRAGQASTVFPTPVG